MELNGNVPLYWCKIEYFFRDIISWQIALSQMTLPTPPW